MRKCSFAAAIGAVLVLTSSATAVLAMKAGTVRETCGVDVKSICAGSAGQEKIRECLMSHMDNLSFACSAKLSARVSLLKECKGDVERMCGDVKMGHVASCLKGHLHKLSRPCRAELALMVAP